MLLTRNIWGIEAEIEPLLCVFEHIALLCKKKKLILCPIS